MLKTSNLDGLVANINTNNNFRYPSLPTIKLNRPERRGNSGWQVSSLKAKV